MITDLTKIDNSIDIAFASPHQSAIRTGIKMMMKQTVRPMTAARTSSSLVDMMDYRMFRVKVVQLYVRS